MSRGQHLINYKWEVLTNKLHEAACLQYVIKIQAITSR